MTNAKLLLVCLVCLMVAAPAAWGQAANSSRGTGIPGFLDPHTGAFRPMPIAPQEETEPAAAVTFGGTVNLTITITLKTTGITNVTCMMTTATEDGPPPAGPFTTYSETNTVAATGTGATRTCKLSIPYSWSLTSQSTDSMTTFYDVFGSAGTSGLPQRTSFRQPLDTRKVPANGTVTTLTASVTQ